MKESDEQEEAVFECALQLPPEQRGDYLDRASAHDPELRCRVEGLLRAWERAGDLLQEPAVAAPTRILGPSPSGSEEVGDQIGRYKLLQRIGEGGCGAVYMAEQKEPVQRRVALKIIKPGMDTKSVVARFEAERQALAMMDHPNIAKFYDAGVTATGRPYFVMELVRGNRITHFCDQNDLDTNARLDLFILVCRAVQHAHQKGVIHRDLKPSNILITSHDGVPVPKVIDFGIAKAIQGRLTDQTLFTAFEQFIGTPAYMSPEQTELSGLDIDTRSDIYSLGVLLYELLTGKTPFDTKVLLAAGLDKMRQTIREQEPLRPSTCLSTMVAGDLAEAAKHRRTEAPNLVNLVRGDLDWIVMKCLEKDRNRRYETANGLAMDIRRYLSSEPVVARPPSAMYRFQKAWRRNKVVFTAATAVGTALLIGACVSAWLASVAMRRTAELSEQAYVADIGLASEALQEGNLGRVRDLLRKHEPRSNTTDLGAFEWRHLMSRAKGNYTDDLGPYIGYFSGIALSPDGQFFAVNRADPPRVDVIRFSSRTVAKSLATELPDNPLVYSSSGKWLVRDDGNKMLCWDTTTWEPRKPAAPLRFPLAFGHGTNEEIFVACSGTNHLELWSATHWRKLGELTNSSSDHPLLEPTIGVEGHMVNALAVSSDDTVVYLAGASAIRRWDLRKCKEMSPFPIARTTCLATSGDGQLAAADLNGKVHLVDAQSGKPLATFKSHTGYITDLNFARDRTTLVSAATDRKLVVYDTAKQLIAGQLLGHETEASTVDISADGRLVVSGAGWGGKALAWSWRKPTLRAWSFRCSRDARF